VLGTERGESLIERVAESLPLALVSFVFELQAQPRFLGLELRGLTRACSHCGEQSHHERRNGTRYHGAKCNRVGSDTSKRPTPCLIPIGGTTSGGQSLIV
jgi:hypothetical protein